jgi:2-methylcitrate dehydratase PrpD
MAVGQERGADETRMLRAFVTAFEVAARLGDHGIGVRLNHAGWHATPTLGGFAVAAGVAALLGLDAARTAHAFGLCATQAGGLAASFGTMGKPLHSGKAAVDGLLAATLAEAGYTGAPQVFDDGGRFLATLLQDPQARFELAPFEDVWEITRNSFKPYAACQLAHGAIDAAQRIRGRIAGRRVRRVTAFVHPLAIRIATVIDPTTPTEAKFCVGFCVALALAGYPLSNDDFSVERLADRSLRAMTARVSMRAEDGIERTATRLEVELESGEVLVEDVRHAFGSIGNPMDWRALDGKFLSSTRAALGARAPALLQTLHRFGERGSLEEALRLTAVAAESPASGAPAA